MVSSLYRAVMIPLERRRLELGIAMRKLDEGAGNSERYYAKALWVDAQAARRARWETVQNYVDCLFPEGFVLTIRPAKTGSLDAGKQRVAIMFAGARYDFEARRDWMREIQKKGASKGGRERARRLSKHSRREIARMGGLARHRRAIIAASNRDERPASRCKRSPRLRSSRFARERARTENPLS